MSQRNHHIYGALMAVALCLAPLTVPLNAVAAEAAAAARENSYAQQIDEAYKAWGKIPASNETIARSTDPNVEALQLRATLFLAQDVRQETKFKLLKRLSDIEKSSGTNSVQLVPILVQLAALPGLDDGLRNLQRAVSIANTAPITPGKKSDNMTAAEWLYMAASPDTFFVVEGGSKSGSAILTDDLRKTMLESSFKLGLKTAGLSSDVFDTLLALLDVYCTQKDTDKLVAIARSTLSALSTSDTDQVRRMKKKFLGNYRQLLNKLHNTAELANLDKISTAEHAREKTDYLISTTEKAKEAEKRAEVDPHGLIEARLRNAAALLSTGDKAKAFEQYRSVIKLYRDMPVINIDYDVTRTMWGGFTSALRKAETKADEQIIYDFIDADIAKMCTDKTGSTLRRRGGFSGQLSDVTRYFVDMHRNDEAIRFLSYARDKVKQVCPDNVDTYNSLSEELRQMYERFGDIENANKVAQEQLASLTLKDANTANHLLGVATFYVRIDNFDKANSIIEQVFSIMQGNPDLFKKRGGLYRFQNVAQEYDRKNKPKEAEPWIRKLIDIIAKNHTQFEDDVSAAADPVKAICKEFCRAGDFESAEALELYAQKSFADFPEKTDFSRDLADIYLKHAAKLQKEGKSSSAKKILALSDEQFDKSLATYSADYIERLKQSRQEQLKQYGLIQQDSK